MEVLGWCQTRWQGGQTKDSSTLWGGQHGVWIQHPVAKRCDFEHTAYQVCDEVGGGLLWHNKPASGML